MTSYFQFVEGDPFRRTRNPDPSSGGVPCPTKNDAERFSTLRIDPGCEGLCVICVVHETWVALGIGDLFMRIV